MQQNIEKKDWLSFKRNAELDTVIKYLPVEKDIKVLEIGGRDGFMAKRIHDLGYDITSIDLFPIYPQHFPVAVGDATKLDFESNQFDFIFTSHLIVEIRELDLFFDECRRVVKKNGLMVHVVPSTPWSLGTNFWHYLLLPKFFINWIRPNTLVIDANSYGKNLVETEKQNTKSKIINVLFLHPIGTNPSFLHDIFSFTKRKWKNLFKNHGFEIVSVENGPHYYTAYGVFKYKLMGMRKSLAKTGFSGSFCYVLRDKRTPND
ncbi:class I SAM-dependent methyltransferase [Flavobacteriaceae bacterium TP-CH-4]|uniref:Class I SAM-dependent methyltransferase n=1 Tax=Pelagihabitans pacificus TaxID=2696054 RepID=A0A967AVQ9_9FLAO|nr:class I SAM-dependent methyltransferase [Pelagihabitans pacificus]NHF61073.1 class I SAM-dependent methyltransferase [Pelagihabitans pacificus]